MFEEEENELDPITGQPIQPIEEQPTPEQAVNDHNLRQSVVADTVSSLTGIPSAAVAPVASFIQGASSILSGLAKVPGQLKFTLGEAFYPELAEQMKQNPEVRKAVYESFQPDDSLDQLGEDMSNLMVQDVDGGVTANLMKGDFADAAQQGVQQLAGAIPSVMATMTGPGGLAAIGLSSLGSNYEETMEEHPTESSMKILGTSLVKAGGEVASEYVTQRLGGAALKMLNKGVSPEVVKKTLGASVKNVFKGFNSEGLSEAAAELLNNGVDALAYGEEFGSPDMWKQLADSYIIGGIMGGGMTSIGEANTYTRNSVLDGSPTKENGKKQKQTQAAINALATEARTIQDPDQMEANEKAKGELEMSLVKDVEQQHKVWDKFSQEETSTYLQLKKDAEGFMNAAESATNPEAKQILEAKADEKIEAADKMYDTVENWDGLMTKADKIEAANKAAEVANPGAVQDHVYGLRPTSTESKIRTEKAKSRKDLDLSIAKIDTDFKTKTEALDKKMSPSDTKIYSSGTLNSERESKELATLHREHVKFKESNERKSDVVFHDEQIPTDAKFKQGEEVGGLQHKRKPKYSPGPLNPNYIKDNKTADKLGEGGYDLNEERGRQISGGKYWRSQSQPTITMPIVDRLTGEIVTEQQMIKNDEAKKRLDSEFKKAEERAAKAKERDHKEFTKSKKRLKNQATADKERARLDSANRNDIAAIQEMNKEGRTGKAEKAGIELMKRNKTLIDWAARNVANWYSPPKTIEEQGGVQIANDINTFKGSKGVKKQYSKKKTTKTEDGSYDTQEVGFTVDGIRDLVMQEALKNVLTFNPDAGVAASTHVFSTNKLVQKVKQQINAEGKVKSSVGRGKSVIYNKQAISDLKEAIGELKEEKAANPESSYLYDDIIKSYQNEVFALENVTPYTHDVDAGFNNPNKADLDAVSDEQSTFIDNYEGVDAALGINPKDSAKMLKYVRSTIESGGLPSISSLIEDSQLDITNTGNEQADADVGAREGKSLDQANLNYADAIRKANPALSKLVNSYVNDLMNTAEDIQLNSATIYDLLPRTIAGKDSKAFNGFFNGVRGSKQAAALPWEGQFEGLKGNHRSTMKLRDAVANAVVDSMVDAVVEANPNIELSVSPSQPGKTPLRPIVSWMNSMMAKTGQKVIISDKIVDQWNEVLAPEARLNGLISKNTGEIYVRSTVGPETVIHEMGHAWATTARAMRPELYKQGVKLAMDSVYVNRVRSNYPGLESESQQRFEEEVMAHAIEDKGKAIVDKYKKNKFQDWVDKFFNAVMDSLGIKATKNPADLTYDEFMTLAASEILSGRGLANAETLAEAGHDYSIKDAFKLTDHITMNPKVANKLKNPTWVKVPSGKKAATEADAFNAARSIIDVANMLPSKARSIFMGQIAKGGRDAATMDAINGIGESLTTTNQEGVFGKDVDWDLASGKMNKNNEKSVQPQKQKALKSIFEAINEGVHSGRINSNSLATIKLMMNNGMDGMLRDTATTKFWHRDAKPIQSAQPGFEREHNLPTTQFFDKAVESIENGTWDSLMDDYNVVVMPKATEKNINKTGIPEVYNTHDYKIGKLPKGYSRYFTGDYAINPANYYTSEGVPMAKEMGVGPEGIAALRKFGADGVEFSVDTNANNDNSKNAEAAVKLRERKIKKIENALNLKGKSIYKSTSPYKQSKVTKETRDILNKFKKQFAGNKTKMTDQQLDQALENINQIVKNGTNDQKVARANYKQQSEARKDSAAKLIKEDSGIDPDTLTPTKAAELAKSKDKWYKRISLAPSANNDFYGLIYNLFGNKQQNREWFENELTKPLEDANLNYIQDKQEMLSNFNSITKNVKGLTKKSGIKIEGVEITRDQAVRIFNHMKNPTLWKQMQDGGVTTEKMNEIIKYMDSNPDLRTYADQVSQVYSKFLTKLNPEMAKHGYRTIGDTAISKNQGDIEMLEKIYGKDNIPDVAPYTPFTAQGVEDSITLENLTDEGGDYYSVMSGNLKRRTGGGKYTFADKTNASDIRRYISGPVRSKNYLDFAKRASDIFSSKNLKAMEAANGKEWGISMKDSLKRIVTGQSGARQGSAEKSIQKFFNETVGGIMFLNTRSALLQLISTANYLVENPITFIKGMTPGYFDAMKMITNSDWMKERGAGRTQLETSELFNDDSSNPFVKAKNYLLEKGYLFTKGGDKTAIAMGGAAYINGLIKEGMSPQDAFKKFVAQTEETQQSTRQERLGRQQTSLMGRAMLAFANTPMQYNRKAWRAAKDIRAGKNVAGNMAKIGYYLGVQNAVFTGLQQLLYSSLDMEDEEETNKIVSGVNSMIDTILRGAGIYGALASTAKNVLKAKIQSGDRQANEKMYEAMLNTLPGLGTKVRQLKNTLQSPYFAKSQADIGGQEVGGVAVSQIANGVSFSTNLPVWRALALTEQVADAFADDLSAFDKFMRAAGWSRWNLNATEEDNDFSFDFDFGGDDDFSFDFDSPINRLNRGESGQAHNDGTIEVDPNLPPDEKAKTIAHEQKHVEDMEKNGLDYDDHSIHYKGKKYPRKNGMIKYEGKWKKEGAKDLPWEKVAYAAEEKVTSPLKKTDHDKPKPGTPEWDAVVKAGKDFNKNWYSNPVAAEKFKEQAPRFKGGASDRFGVIDETHVDEGPASGAEAEYWRSNFADPSKGEHKHNIEINPNTHLNEGLVAHETTHAAGFDYDLGKVTKGILGDGARKDQWGRYINNPDEQYANLQQIRQELGLKPDQRDLTADQLMKLAEEKGSDDTKAYIKNFGADKVSKAHNTVAENKPKKKKRSLKDLYSNKFNNSRNA